jgi:SAM-dependent methyltransferase
MTVKSAIVSTIDRLPAGHSLLSIYERLRPRRYPVPAAGADGALENVQAVHAREIAEFRRQIQAAHAREIAELHHRIGTLETEKIFWHYEGTRYRWQTKALARELYGEPKKGPRPPEKIPTDLLDGYTMGGRIPIEYVYMDATYPSNWPTIYADEEIDDYIQSIRQNGTFIYGGVDHTVQEALRRYPIKGLDVVTMGSLTPWYEAMILAHGGRAHTIDYNPITVRSSRIKAWTTVEWERERPQFDYAFSISSFEHDGLGAFGDPLDPDGDLKAMKKMKQILKPGGLMLFAVPMGKDCVRFNQNRVYGRLRTPLMLQGWEWIDSVAFEDFMYEARGEYQPILVLKNS